MVNWRDISVILVSRQLPERQKIRQWLWFFWPQRSERIWLTQTFLSIADNRPLRSIKRFDVLLSIRFHLGLKWRVRGSVPPFFLTCSRHYAELSTCWLRIKMGCETITPNSEYARVRPGRRWNEILEAYTRNNVSNPSREELNKDRPTDFTCFIFCSTCFEC